MPTRRGVANVAGAQEVLLTTSGGWARRKRPASFNIIRATGGNNFTGRDHVRRHAAHAGNNYTDKRRRPACARRRSMMKVREVNPMGGGRSTRPPWFYLTYREVYSRTPSRHVVTNNAGDQTKVDGDFDPAVRRS